MPEGKGATIPKGITSLAPCVIVTAGAAYGIGIDAGQVKVMRQADSRRYVAYVPETRSTKTQESALTFKEISPKIVAVPREALNQHPQIDIMDLLGLPLEEMVDHVVLRDPKGSISLASKEVADRIGKSFPGPVEHFAFTDEQLSESIAEDDHILGA